MEPSYAASLSMRSLLAGQARFGSSPRFGHSKEFADLFSQEDGARNDYIVGILIMALILFSVFLIWGIMLVAFRCCLGRQRVGFLSGAPFQATGVDPGIMAGQATFGMSLVFFVIFAILLVTAGIGNLDTTTTSIGHGATLGYDYLSEAQTNLGGVMQLAEILREMKDNLLEILTEFLKAIQLARNVVEGSGDIESAVGVLVEGMGDLKDVLGEHLREIDSSLIDGQETCVDVHTVTEEISLQHLQVGVGLLMTIVPTLLLGCLYWTVLHGNTRNATYSSVIRRLRSCVFFPIFVLLVIVCIVVGCSISIVGLLNADFCSGGADKSPDSTIIEIMNKRGLDPDSFKYRAVEYVVRDCALGALATKPPLNGVGILESQLNRTTFDIDTAIDAMLKIGKNVLTNTTGYDTATVINQLEEIRSVMENVLERLVGFVQSLACRPLYAIYSTVTHEAACTNSYTGTVWIFVSLLFMSFFGLLAITFRAALYPVIEDSWDLELEEEKLSEMETKPSKPLEIHPEVSLNATDRTHENEVN